MPRAIVAVLLLCVFSIKANAAPQGDGAAVAQAERLLTFVGGARWAARTLVVHETGYLRSGVVAKMVISRDFAAGARVITMVRDDGQTRTEVLSNALAWETRDGATTRLTGAQLQSELQGLAQEPYAIYHRLARGGDGLRVVLAENGRKLEVHAVGGNQLCWFDLDGKGAPIGWGNIFDGRTVQHYYGPYAAMGGAAFPKWGAAFDGSFRFEYTGAQFSDATLQLPAMPR
jgi:hypothetical protein